MYIMIVTIPYICCQEVLINPLYVTSFTIAGMHASCILKEFQNAFSLEKE